VTVDKANFSHPTRTVDLSGKGTVDVLAMSDMTVNRMTFQPGWRWTTHAAPVMGSPTCQTFHHGFVTSGRITVRMNDGAEEEFGAGDVWIVPPGHDAWVVGDEPVVVLEFTPAATS
jgi:quercetin dioxygenase-like cupin family protein